MPPSDDVRRIVEETFRLRDSGENKAMPLSRAIATLIKPRMSLFTSRNCSAAAAEVVRQFHGESPGFTLITMSMRDYNMLLAVAGGLSKSITTSASYSYPSPAPIPLVQEAVRSGKLQVENWSLLSLQQRLMAGAMGCGFMPTVSLLGSSMAQDNRESFHVLKDPFGSGREVGLAKALNPDIALVHGCVADPFGNTILATPGEDPYWGPWASGGVIVTVEKIVSPDFIREHATQVRIPGYMVKAVCEVPFGAHPAGLVHHELRGFESYGADYDFLSGLRQASQNQVAMDAWLQEWILGVQDQQGYLQKLGAERAVFLKGKGQKGAWEHRMESLFEQVDWERPPSPAEVMMAAASRHIVGLVQEREYRTVLVGVGVSGITGWVSHYRLLREGYTLELILGSGQLGHSPRPGDPMLTNISNIPTSKMLTDSVSAYAAFVGGETNSCISVLGAAQVDRFGNINTTKLTTSKGETFLTGTGGANDAINSRESVLVMHQSRNRFVEQVEYVTCPGGRISTLISPLGMFRKLNGDRDFTLVACLSDGKCVSLEERVAAVRANCGWEVKVAPQIEDIPPPTVDELTIMRALDPERAFLGD
ncbi:MAG: CoA-transferase [Dehalococcoidia bacterium]|nr:CoA-transferase [Dehalococcoidia bacterium]